MPLPRICDFCHYQRSPVEWEGGGVVGDKHYCVHCAHRADRMWKGSSSSDQRHIGADRELYIRDWAKSDSEPLACHAMRELLEEIDFLRDIVFEATLSPKRKESSPDQRREPMLPEIIEAQRQEIAWLLKEIDNTIEILIPADCRVRVCEGGGPEDICKSLATSVAKLAVRAESKPQKPENPQVLALYDAGFADGLRAYAWWKDGIQYVGTTGERLVEAIGKRRLCWSYGTTDLTDVMENAK